jgi:hypothetical protein
MNPNRESYAALPREELMTLGAAQAAEIAWQAAEIAALKAQFAELERPLGLNRFQQRQAAVERRPQEAGAPGSDHKPARGLEQTLGRAEGTSERAPGASCGARPHRRSRCAILRRLRSGVDACHKHRPPPARCSTCPSRCRSSSPNIAPMIAVARLAERRPAARFPYEPNELRGREKTIQAQPGRKDAGEPQAAGKERMDTANSSTILRRLA